MAVLIDSAARINFKLTPESDRTVEKRRGMSDLGGARQDISRHRRASEFVVRQRKDLSGYGAPQIELHKLDARGRRRHRNWSHTGESAEMAVLDLCASPAAFRRRPLRSWMSRATTTSGTAWRRPPPVAMNPLSLIGSRLAFRRVVAVGGFNCVFCGKEIPRIRRI